MILVLTVGVAFGVYGFFGNPNDQRLSSLTLALLGVVAFVLLRNRGRDSNLEDLKVVANRALSHRPYEVQAQTSIWDLTTRDDSTYEITQRLMFTRDDVTTLDHWTLNGPGPHTIVGCTGEWRMADGGPWKAVNYIHEFDIRSGKMFVFCFDREFKKGDTIEWRVHRTMLKRFPGSTEAVGSESATATGSRRKMRITWPPGDKPTNVQLCVPGESPGPITPSNSGGRTWLEVEVPHTKPGDQARIEWDW